MLTKTQTTYILLERGTEDMDLLKDILRVFSTLGFKSEKELILFCPVLYELKQNLEKEKEVD